MMASRTQQGLTGWHVLMILIAFFGIVLAANAVLITDAVGTHSGSVGENPYMSGLAYNRRIEFDQRQSQLGWHADLETDQSGRLGLAIHDGAGTPIRGLAILATLSRPVTNTEDRELKLTEISAGRYEARSSPLASGAWIVTIDARAAGAPQGVEIFRLRRRQWLQP